MKTKTSNIQVSPELHKKLMQMALNESAREGKRVSMAEIVERLLAFKQALRRINDIGEMEVGNG